jgi:hypothetical protein
VKTFYSLEDIETLVAQGVRELIVDEDSVLTAVAQDAAARLGLKLLPKGQAAAAPVQPLPAPAASLGARPRGCQHGPLEGSGGPAARSQTGPAPAPKAARPGAPSGAPSGGLVDDLVGAVRQMANKGSAG